MLLVSVMCGDRSDCVLCEQAACWSMILQEHVGYMQCVVVVQDEGARPPKQDMT